MSDTAVQPSLYIPLRPVKDDPLRISGTLESGGLHDWLVPVQKKWAERIRTVEDAVKLLNAMGVYSTYTTANMINRRIVAGYQPFTLYGKYKDANKDYSTPCSVNVMGVPVLHFTHSHYPACCGIQMIHTFNVLPQTLTPELEELLTDIFKAFTDYRNSTARRYEVVMVEVPPYEHVQEAVRRDPNLYDWPVVKNPNMCHKPLWEFFHKTAKKVNTRLMYNKNSGNLLHNMEVLF